MSLASSSPRLPSPPPPAEIQIGPKSPSMGPHATRQAQQIEQTAIDANAKRRIHPGTKSADMAAGPPLVPLQELDSAFQLQEHLAALHYYHTVGNTSPITRETAKLLATPPPGTDKTLWLYELCRFLIAQCNSLIVGFLFDTPPCSAATCPEMRASEWQFLCAVHDAPKSCCAIDYCCHTLDWAANVVTNPKIFPSRFSVDAHDKNTALKNLVNVFRRLHRIFAHAWFQHRGVFWSVEGQTGLYVLFKTVCDVYDLLPAENYKLPPEAEGLESADTVAERTRQQQAASAPTSIAKAPGPRAEAEEDYNSALNRSNTRRHIKGSPSVGSAVTTVPEADEDDGTEVTSKMRAMRLSSVPAESADEEMELANIPVIVEHRPVEQPPFRSSSVIPPPAAILAKETAIEEKSPIPEPATPTPEQQKPSSEPEPELREKPEAEEDAKMSMSAEPELPASAEVSDSTADDQRTPDTDADSEPAVPTPASTSDETGDIADATAIFDPESATATDSAPDGKEDPVSSSSKEPATSGSEATSETEVEETKEDDGEVKDSQKKADENEIPTTTADDASAKIDEQPAAADK
ncbi:Mob1/phocein family protein [Cercophora scortea]|uniref:Mob1/phocein family protein n=1 Tax=Cercophora scortea TaxID=314031 RepID=A0AAE0IFQ8_9PEZI|nr:Mob1/phocein family protein [Cercophora scortea]